MTPSKRLNLSGSARRVLVSANVPHAQEGHAQECSARMLGGNRSVGDHVLHRRAPSLVPAEHALLAGVPSPRSSLTNSALKGGAKRVVAHGPPAPSPSSARGPASCARVPASPMSARAAPGRTQLTDYSVSRELSHEPRTPALPTPKRTPSRVSLALEELSALGYTPSRLTLSDADAPGPCALAGRLSELAAPATPDAGALVRAQVDTPPEQTAAECKMATPPPSPTEALPPAAATPDGGVASGACERGVTRALGSAARVAVPFSLPSAGTPADGAAVAAFGKALAEAPRDATPARKRGSHELEALGISTRELHQPLASPARYAIARVSRSAQKEGLVGELATELALTPVRRSARLATHQPGSSVHELLEEAHYVYMPNPALKQQQPPPGGAREPAGSSDADSE
ncbi:hypothetical protein T492DRAFT_1059592 [Pavlovales sp. CCMP2436]|nr:hypothetical protein T492DRAFT_1059592 [Pavlovales sp. CCMP2436]|mmetsp:Transcript_5623/g.14677  ORF Transcript_5623/g.14677 Transcript_5623/m.14677 type:complete len:404 (+) Transcript_5623:1-1212(+)